MQVNTREIEIILGALYDKENKLTEYIISRERNEEEYKEQLEFAKKKRKEVNVLRHRILEEKNEITRLMGYK